MKRNRIRTVRIVLIAAAVTALLGATAYAAGLFGLKGREVTPEESFPVHFGTEWDEAYGAWRGTYALEFESPETCQPVRYRLGWLPEEKYQEMGMLSANAVLDQIDETGAVQGVSGGRLNSTKGKWTIRFAMAAARSEKAYRRAASGPGQLPTVRRRAREMQMPRPR